MIWYNKEEHVNDYEWPFHSEAYIFQRVNEYVDAVNMNKIVMERGNAVKLIAWSPPNRNWMKLNIDGACKDNMISGCGVVITYEKVR